MAIDPSQPADNLVTWALSGTYDNTKPLLIDAEEPSRHLTKADIISVTARLAGLFDPGETICLHLSNDILYPVLVLAILASGCCWTGTNTAYLCNELRHHLESSRTTTVITSSENLAVVQAAVQLCSRPVQIVLLSDAAFFGSSKRDSGNRPHIDIDSTVERIEDLLHDQKLSTISLSDRLKKVAGDSAATIMSTSGTTGLPKMVQRSHRALICETKAIEDNNSAKGYPVRRLYCTPIFHAFSFPEMVVNTIRLGHPSYYMGRFDDTFTRKIHDFQITESMVVPTMLSRLAQQAAGDDDTRRNIQSLQMVLCAGAPLSAAVRATFLRKFDHVVRVVQVWGMSEGGWFSTFQHPEIDETGSVGRPVPSFEVRVDSDTIVELADGSLAGELLVKSPQLMRQYLGNGKATEESFGQDGWLRSGDIGFLRDGKVYLVDRAKDIIKVNGWTVSPAELEATVLEHLQVLDVATLSLGEGQDEHPLVLVVAKPQVNLEQQEIKEHLLNRLARYKVATAEVKFITSIPRNPSGKILRRMLKEQVESGNI
ncbi:AMP binding enzyme like protein [Zymoseptoria brevis]|uniref:AMP binding enzyme like protein n=1 Tax=Zymoseptoria brevis TaxID=1047168 RepID=A0A0F4GA77_9PEZI|nr:AMP binding enzyme like protein [Zymoseptoria brevis]